jgi:hypothetical protein
MIDISKILNDYGKMLTERLKNDIKTKQVTKYGAVNASGKLHDSIAYKVEGAVLTITGNSYIYFLQYGRKKTEKGSEPGKLRPIIRQWIDEKGIVPRDGISKDSLAYLITRKIHEEGTSIWQQGGTDLVSGIFNEQLVNELNDSFGMLISAEVSSEILKLQTA